MLNGLVSGRAAHRLCTSQPPHMPPKYDSEATGLQPELCLELRAEPRLGARHHFDDADTQRRLACGARDALVPRGDARARLRLRAASLPLPLDLRVGRGRRLLRRRRRRPATERPFARGPC